MVLFSDNNNFAKTTVVTFSFYVLNHIQGKFKTEVQNIEIWTDGTSSQFKNKSIFTYGKIILPHIFDFKFTWNYSATRNGKGLWMALGVH